MDRHGWFARLGRYALVGGEKAVRIPIGILVSGLASRALGPDGFGVFSSMLVLVTVIAPLASFGLESLGIAAATRSGGASAYLRSMGSFRLTTGVAATGTFLLAAFSYFESSAGSIAPYATCVLSTVFIMRVYEIGENLLFAQERLVTLAAVRISAFLAASAMIIAMLLVKPDISALLALNALEALFLLVAYSVLFRADIGSALKLQEGGNLGQAWQQCRMAMPVFASGVLVLVLLNADKLLVFRVMGQAGAGLYCSAAKLVDVLYFIPIVIGTSHAASFARDAGSKEFNAQYRSAFMTATWLAAGAAGALGLLAGPLVPALFGSAFAEAATTLTLLAPCLVAVTWVSLRTRALAALDRRREILALTVVAFVIHMPLLWIGLHVGSIEAVAVAQTTGWLLAAVVVPLFFAGAREFAPTSMLRIPR